MGKESIVEGLKRIFFEPDQKQLTEEERSEFRRAQQAAESFKGSGWILGGKNPRLKPLQ